MSRSFKKTHMCYVACSDNKTGHRKGWKTLYNRRMRRRFHDVDLLDPDTYDADLTPQHNTYRRMNEKWNIDDGMTCDFYGTNPWELSERDYYACFVSK